MEIKEINGIINIYNDGVLIVSGRSYNDIENILNMVAENIQDLYQLNLIKEILSQLKLRKVV